MNKTGYCPVHDDIMNKNNEEIGASLTSYKLEEWKPFYRLAGGAGSTIKMEWETI